MKIGAFGCSFLFGSDLADIQNEDCVNWFIPSKHTYPALIAKTLNLEYYCTALPGQGNKVIADDIMRAVEYNSNNMVYIINWTYIDRFEYLADARVGKGAIGWNSTLPGNTSKQSKFYNKHFYTDLDAKLSNLMYIKTATDCLRENNCKFIMTYMDHLLFDTIYDTTVSIEYLQKNIQNHLQNYESDNFLEWARKNNFSVSKHCHPLEQAHEAAAKYWLPTVTHMLNNRTQED